MIVIDHYYSSYGSSIKDVDGITYFPYCPGIAWTITNGKARVRPSCVGLLNDKLQNNDLTVIAYGGLLETYCSLYVLEALNLNVPSANLYWEGNPAFKLLIETNGLAKMSKNILGEKVVYQYPLPVFFDKDDKAYFNCLYNYFPINTRQKMTPAHKIFTRNIFGFDKKYLPKMRDVCYPESLAKSLMLQKIDPNKFLVVLFPDKAQGSLHDVDCLGWGVKSIKSFYSMLKQSGIQLVIATNTASKYYEFPCVSLNIENAIYLLSSANVILSRTVDYLHVGYMMGAATMSKQNYKLYSVSRLTYAVGEMRGDYHGFERYKFKPIMVAQRIKKIKDGDVK